MLNTLTFWQQRPHPMRNLIFSMYLESTKIGYANKTKGAFTLAQFRTKLACLVKKINNSYLAKRASLMRNHARNSLV